MHGEPNVEIVDNFLIFYRNNLTPVQKKQRYLVQMISSHIMKYGVGGIHYRVCSTPNRNQKGCLYRFHKEMFRVNLP